MFKLPSILLVLLALLIAGCGGGGGAEEASSPLDEALRYLPADAPFAVAIETDTSGEQFQAAEDIADQFGFKDDILDEIEESFDGGEGQVERLEKALGNEFVVGSSSARAFVNERTDQDDSWVGAIQASSQKAVSDLLEQEEAKADGEASGAKLYKDDDGDTFAIKDDVLVVGGARKEVLDALERREGDDTLTEEDFDAGTEGVPSDALIRVYLDVEGLLDSSEEAEEALKIKWVRALRTAGIALSVQEDEVAIEFNIKTDPEGLSDEDLPIAAGAEAPQVLDREGEIGIALRDPAQLLEFAQAAGKSADPNGFADFEAGKQQIERRLKIDIDEDIIDQLRGDLSVSVDLDGKFGARAELEDPAAFERTLEKIAEVLPDLVETFGGEGVGFAKPKPGEDFYALATADGQNIVFGVVDGVFVLSNDATVAGTLAADDTQPVAGAKGAFVLNTDAERLARSIFGQVEEVLDSQSGEFNLDIGKRIREAIGFRPLDELIGSLEATTEGLSGSFKLTLD